MPFYLFGAPMKSSPLPAALNVTGVAAAMALLYVFRGMLWPLAMAFVLAILINALVRAIVRAWPKASKLTVMVLASAIVGALVISSIVVVVGGAAELASQLPRLTMRLDDLIQQGGRLVHLQAPLSLMTLVASLDLPALAGRVFASLQDAVSGMLLTVLFLIFLLASRHLIKAKLEIIADFQHSAGMMAALERTVKGVEVYVWIQTVTGLMIAGASGAVMMLAGLDNALFWTLALFLLSYIPVLGVAVGSVAPALFALLQFSTVWPAVAIFLGIQAVSFLVGNLVLPKMQADSQNIDPSISLLVIGIWSVLWGIPGAFLAIPLTLALMLQLAQFESLRWLAVLISNDGHPGIEVPEEGAGDSRSA